MGVAVAVGGVVVLVLVLVLLLLRYRRWRVFRQRPPAASQQGRHARACSRAAWGGGCCGDGAAEGSWRGGLPVVHAVVGGDVGADRREEGGCAADGFGGEGGSEVGGGVVHSFGCRGGRGVGLRWRRRGDGGCDLERGGGRGGFPGDGGGVVLLVVVVRRLLVCPHGGLVRLHFGAVNGVGGRAPRGTCAGPVAG